jgi:peptidoglycan/xylan/chitin deacetylase (PgdA/CDA1 family)
MSIKADRSDAAPRAKRVTLTFDNGPTKRVTPLVLNELASRGMPAWFCIVGEQLARGAMREMAQRALQEGHRLANHSLTHRIPLGEKPTLDHAAREVGEMHELMTRLLGNFDERWFRPFGRGGSIGPHLFSSAALAELRRLRYSVMLWSSVPRDWEDTAGWVDTALADVERQDHTVVVLHDLATGAMDNLPRFLDELEARDITVTNSLPPGCVPIDRGEPRRDLAPLTSSSPT